MPITTRENGVELTRSVTEEHPGIWQRVIYGLNVFAANGVSIADANDPRYLFLKFLAIGGDAYVHIDSWLFNQLWSPTDEFLAAFIASESRRVDMGITREEFRALEPSDDRAIVARWTVDLSNRLDPRDVSFAFESDAMCLYTGVRPDRRDEFLRMFEVPFPGSDEWMRRAADLCECLVLSYYDAWCFSVYARDPRSFETLDAAIAASEKSIRDSEWYGQHRSELRWDSEEDECPKPAAAIKPHDPNRGPPDGRLTG